MAAAERLIQKGLISVDRHESGSIVGLNRDDALEVVKNFDNWWRYGPRCSEDDDEDDGRNPIQGGALANESHRYSISDVNHGQQAIINWQPPKSTDSKS